MTEPTRLEVGRIGKAHGLRGEVLLALSSNRIERVAKGSKLFIDGQERIVRSSRPHQGKHLVQFTDIGDRNAAEALRGQIVEAEPMEDTDELWVHELLGADVVNVDLEPLGTVLAVEANPASDLLVLEGDVLVPLTFFVERNAAGQLVVDPPPGLFDLNAPDPDGDETDSRHQNDNEA